MTNTHSQMSVAGDVDTGKDQIAGHLEALSSDQRVAALAFILEFASKRKAERDHRSASPICANEFAQSTSVLEA